MEYDLRCLRHAGDRFSGEVPQLVDIPRILIFLNQMATIIGVLDFVEEKLAVRLDRIDAGRAEELVKVFVEPTDVLLGDHRDLSPRYTVFCLHFDCLILLSNFAMWCDAAPIALDGMPDCDMFDVLVFATNVSNSGFQSSRKAGFVCFELDPPIIELSSTISLCFMSDGSQSV